MRKVIFHYHLFKNAGTSLDAAFKENFKGDEWVTAEFPTHPAKNREMVKQWIIDNPQAKCFSSHTALLPPPKIEGLEVLPVIFLRHPIDRIVSAYNFEKHQISNSFGPTLARNTNLKGYIETRIALVGDNQCNNFYLNFFSKMFFNEGDTDLAKSLMAIEKLPFIGVVEDYTNSLRKLQIWLQANGFMDIKLKVLAKNLSRGIDYCLQERILNISLSLGPSMWRKTKRANREDLILYKNCLVKNNVT